MVVGWSSPSHNLFKNDVVWLLSGGRIRMMLFGFCLGGRVDRSLKYQWVIGARQVVPGQPF